ncbi:hypothetical protein M2298_004152 [Brevibacillus sp. 1238]|nr:hypothetical protein [Brevibacillus sp. 1238]
MLSRKPSNDLLCYYIYKLCKVMELILRTFIPLCLIIRFCVCKHVSCIGNRISDFFKRFLAIIKLTIDVNFYIFLKELW